MKVRITFEFDDDERRAIGLHYGQPGKAGHDSMQAWVRSTVEAALESIADDAEQNGAER